MRHAFTIDVEDYWSIISRDHFNSEISPTENVVGNTQWYLQLLDRHQIKATFFVLGDVAKAYPGLIRMIAGQNHELGVHGFFHKQIFKMDRAEFYREISDCKKLLEDIAGRPVLGHRAPAFSITLATRWALEVLAEAGFKYDSSIFPVKARRYGWPDFPLNIVSCKLPSGREIIEAPMSAVKWLGRYVPIAGGGYVRHFPYWVTKKAIREVQSQRPVILYLHPYEIELTEQSLHWNQLPFPRRMALLFKHKLQFRNRKKTKWKMQNLLEDFSFTTLLNVIEKAEKNVFPITSV